VKFHLSPPHRVDGHHQLRGDTARRCGFECLESRMLLAADLTGAADVSFGQTGGPTANISGNVYAASLAGCEKFVCSCWTKQARFWRKVSPTNSERIALTICCPGGTRSDKSLRRAFSKGLPPSVRAVESRSARMSLERSSSKQARFSEVTIFVILKACQSRLGRPIDRSFHTRTGS